MFSGKRLVGVWAGNRWQMALLYVMWKTWNFILTSDESGKGCEKGNGMILFGLQRCLWWQRIEFLKRTKETSDKQFNLWVRKLPWSRNGRPLQYSCLENSMDRGAWWTTVRKVTESHITEWLITCNKVVLLNSKIHRAWVNAERRWRRGENRHQTSFERRSHKRKLAREVNSCVSWCVWG